MYKAVIWSGENYRFQGATLDAPKKKELIRKISKHFKTDYKTLNEEFKTKDDEKGRYFYYLKKAFGFEGYVILVTDANNHYVSLFED